MRIILAVFFSLTLFIACNRQAQPEDQATETVLTVASGTVKRLADFESKYVTKRNVDIWLPDDYSTTEKYAVLYMHDGQLLFDSTDTWNKQEWGVDEALSALLQNGEVRKTIVVGVWNISKERHADYFPQKPFESLPKELQDSLLQANRGPDQPLFGTDVRADHYLKFLVEELKPYIDANFSTLTEAEHTFVAGSSMGGLISMYAICEYPEVFSGAACISTHWPGTFTVENNPIPAAFRSYLQANLPDPTTHKIYFDFGTATLDALYEPLQLKVDTIMMEKGYDSTNWVTKKFEGENHSENSWKKRIDIPLKFLLKK